MTMRRGRGCCSLSLVPVECLLMDSRPCKVSGGHGWWVWPVVKLHPLQALPVRPDPDCLPSMWWTNQCKTCPRPTPGTIPDPLSISSFFLTPRSLYPPSIYRSLYPPSIYLSLYPPSIYLSLYPPSIYLSLYPPSIYLSLYPPSIYLSLYPPSIYLSLYPPSIYLSLYPPSIYLSLYPPSIYLSLYPPSIYLSLYPPSIYISLTLYISHSYTYTANLFFPWSFYFLCS